MSIYGNNKNLKSNNAINHSNSTFNNSIKTKPQTGSNIGFMAKLGTGLGAGGYGLNKINDLNDHPNNISDFGHVGKVFGIGENEASIGTSVGSSSEAMPSTGGTFPILKDKNPLGKINFKEKLKNLKLRERH